MNSSHHDTPKHPPMSTLEILGMFALLFYQMFSNHILNQSQFQIYTFNTVFLITLIKTYNHVAGSHTSPGVTNPPNKTCLFGQYVMDELSTE